MHNLKDEEYINNNFLVLATKKGVIKKTRLEAYSRPRQNGINAITIREGDELLDVKLTGGKHEVILASRSGRAIRFNEEMARPMGRNASGVRGITLADNEDRVIGLVCVEDPSSTLLVVSEKGFGKRTYLEDYRITNRGGKGVKTLNLTEKTGALVSIQNVVDADDLMIVTRSGIVIRISIKALRVMGRAPQGVRLIRLNEGDAIASVASIQVLEESLEDEELPPQSENGADESPE